MAAFNRADLEKRITDADQAVADGEEKINRLEAQIVDLARSGLLTPAPLALLRSFRDAQVLHVANRDQLREELDRA